LQAAGADVVFASLPGDVPGLADLEERRARLANLEADAALRAAIASPDLLAALRKTDARPEPAASLGLRSIRRWRENGADYLLVNVSDSRFDAWVPLAGARRHALLLDPLDGAVGAAPIRRGSVYLQLEPGRSMLVRLYSRDAPRTRPWRYAAPAGEGTPIAGPWRITFLNGGPELPSETTMDLPASWTTVADPRAQAFSGTARYRATFDAPAAQADDWLLDLGDVREAARVRLNGRDLGVAWSLPFQLRLGALQPEGNVLEIDVTNLPANRVRDLDLRKVDWKIMGDINLASLRYKALDASRWDVEPSGLNSPVKLVPLRYIKPR